MSITSCFLLFLLFLSMHACSAHRLGAVGNKNKIKKELHFSIKNVSGFKKKLTVQAESTSLKETSIETQHAADHDTQKLEDAEQVNTKTVENEKDKTPPGALVQGKKSVGSVTWRVPHRKRGEKNIGFNQDYAPPRTHPPAHN